MRPSSRNGTIATAPGWRMYSRVPWLPSGSETTSRRTLRNVPSNTSSPETNRSVRSEGFDDFKTDVHQHRGGDAEQQQDQAVRREQHPHLHLRLTEGDGPLFRIVEVHQLDDPQVVES